MHAFSREVISGGNKHDPGLDYALGHMHKVCMQGMTLHVLPMPAPCRFNLSTLRLGGTGSTRPAFLGHQVKTCWHSSADGPSDYACVAGLKNLPCLTDLKLSATRCRLGCLRRAVYPSSFTPLL